MVECQYTLYVAPVNMEDSNIFVCIENPNKLFDWANNLQINSTFPVNISVNWQNLPVVLLAAPGSAALCTEQGAKYQNLQALKDSEDYENLTGSSKKQIDKILSLGVSQGVNPVVGISFSGVDSSGMLDFIPNWLLWVGVAVGFESVRSGYKNEFTGKRIAGVLVGVLSGWQLMNKKKD